MRVKLMVFALITCIMAAVSAEEILVESRQGGKNFSWYSEIKGDWFDSVAKSYARGCSPESVGSRFVTTDGTPPDAEARFCPIIPKPGKYDIYVTWGRSGNAYHAKYIIRNGTKKEVKYSDQAGWGGDLPSNPNRWILLGTFDLPAGQTAYVSVNSAEVTGKPDVKNLGRLYADAVRFVSSGAVSTRPRIRPTPSPVFHPQVTPSSPFALLATPPPYPTPTPLIARTPAPYVAFGQVQWYNTYREALRAGALNNKSILLFLYSGRGKVSQKMDSEILKAPGVTAKLAQYYVCCKLDISQNVQLCNYYSVFKAPVLIFLDSRGYSRARLDTLLTPAQLTTELEKYK